MTIQELIEKRLRLVAEGRSLVERAKEEKRDLTSEENENFSRYMNDVQDLDERIENLQRLEKAEKENRTPTRTLPGDMAPGSKPEGVSVRASDEYRKAFATFLVYGDAGLNSEERRMLQSEIRGMQQDSAVKGGYLVPETFFNTLIKKMDALVFLRQLATKLTVTGGIGVPTLDSDLSDAEWTAEVPAASIAEDDSMRIGKREMFPHKLTKLVKASEDLLRNAVLDIEGLLAERLAYKFAVTEEKHFMTGSGARQPLGLFTPSADGIDTDRDVVGGGTDALSFDGLLDVIAALDEGYQAEASFIFHRAAITKLAKLKDGNGQYIWQPRRDVSEPNAILGYPYRVSKFAPSVFTTGKYVGMFGVYRYYWIADNLNLTVQKLVELFSLTNQVGWKGVKNTDGAPVLSEAFVRIKLA